MNTRLFRLCVVFLAATIAAAAQPVSRTPQQQLEPLLRELDLAANAHDTDRFLKAFLHQSALTFLVDGTVIHGWDDLHTQQAKWWNNGQTDIVYRQSSAPAFYEIDAATVIVTETMTGTGKRSDGQTITLNLAVSMLWKKLPEGWRIVYAHESSAH